MINALSQDLGAGGSSAPGPGAPGPSARRPGASESGVQGLRLTLRASVGTCAALGLARERCDVLPTTAYLLLGDRCRRTCAFCAQSSLSTAAAGMLSRVNWPEIDLDRLVSQLIRLSSASVSRTASASVSASATGPARVDAADCDRFALKRICIQVTDCEGTMEDLCVLVPLLKSSAQIPVSVSYKPDSLADIGRLLSAGVDRLGIAIDAAEPLIYSEVKGGDFLSAKQYLISAASQYPGKISTHVIVGLGESEESVIRTVSEFIECGITVALFALTPVRGTLTESRTQPDIGSYRRIQAASHLLRLGFISVNDFQFEDGRIRALRLSQSKLLEHCSPGKLFRLRAATVVIGRSTTSARDRSCNYLRPLIARD